jgi:glycosyltransferase involved in cell wall biosynthesis
VLIVTYHFPPSSASGSFRMLGFARHLPAHGWRGVVVAPPSLPWEPVDADLANQIPPETVVQRVAYPTSKIARRLALFSCWLPRAARACGQMVRAYRLEAVLTSGPPHQVHGLGLWLKRRYGLPWLADFRDPWYRTGQFERGSGLSSWWIGRQEACVMRGADAVIANAPGACRALREAYPELRGKFVTLPNGYDREAFEALVADPNPRSASQPIRVVHTGAIYAGRDPRPLLDAVKIVGTVEGRPVAVDFFGPPPENADYDLAREIEARSLGDKLAIFGQVPYARVLREMVSADINVLMDNPGRTIGVPAKLYEYLGAGRPILALGEPDGDLAWVLGQSGVPYRIAPPGNPAAIAEAIAELARESGIERDGSSLSERHRFSRAAIAARLAALLDRTVAGGPAVAGEEGEMAHAQTEHVVPCGE